MKITRYELNSDEGIFEKISETGEWCCCDEVEELQKQNEELIKLLALYIDSDYENGTDDLTWQAIEYIQQIKQIPIEEILKEV